MGIRSSSGTPETSGSGALNVHGTPERPKRGWSTETIQQIADDDSDIQRIGAAPLYLRVPALLIDGLLLAVTTIIFGPATDGTVINVFSITVGFALNPSAFLMSVLLLALLEWLTGKTAGKLVMGIRVIGVEDGEPIGLIRAVGRRAFIIIESYMLFVPSLILLAFHRNFDGHLGDRLTGAIVARDSDISRAFPVR